MTAFIALDTSVLDRQIEGLIEAINATTIAVQQVLTAVESLSTRIDALEGNQPDEPAPPVEPPTDPPTDPPADPPPIDPPVEPSLSALADENGDALTDESDQVLTEGAADA